MPHLLMAMIWALIRLISATLSSLPFVAASDLQQKAQQL